MATGYTIDRNGRARVRGRFISEAERKAIYYAESGQLTAEYVGRSTWYRGPDGRRVAAKYAALSDHIPTIVGHGKRRREVAPEKLRTEETPFPGRARGIAFDLHFNSAARLVGDIAATGGNQWVKWRGKYFKVTPERAGALQDVFASIHSRYIDLFKDYTESPQLSIPFIETTKGDVYNLDNLETMDEDLAEGLQGDEGAEEAQILFEEYVKSLMDKATRYQLKSKHAKTTNTKANGKRQQRSKPRGKAGKGRRKG